MLRIAALLTATYLAAFLATSALTAPEGLGAALDRIVHALERVEPRAFLPAQDAQAQDAHGPGRAEPALPKADALAMASAPPRLRGAIAPGDASADEPAEVEALPGGRLALRDADGRLLLLHDPAERTTRVARGARLPRLLAEPVGDEPRLDVVPSRGRPPVETEVPDGADEPLASGCESALSPLARARRGAGAVLCLAAL